MKLGLQLISKLSWLLLAVVPVVHAGEKTSAVVNEIARGVYSLHSRSCQSISVIDNHGIIVTDPVSAITASVYLGETRKLQAAPVRYVVYSHHHFDHIDRMYVYWRNVWQCPDWLKKTGNPEAVEFPVKGDGAPGFPRRLES